MIKLDIQPYCDDCSVFEADVEMPRKAYLKSCMGEEIVTQSDTIVRCGRRHMCAGIKRYLEKEMKGE